jgi:hypothetical protein
MPGSYTGACLARVLVPRLENKQRRCGSQAQGVVAAVFAPDYISPMDTIRIAERLSEGGVFTENQAKRIATTLADHLKDELATKRDLDVLEARLRTEFQSGIGSVRNQLLTAQVAAFFGIILYITFRL